MRIRFLIFFIFTKKTLNYIVIAIINFRTTAMHGFLLPLSVGRPILKKNDFAVRWTFKGWL